LFAILSESDLAFLDALRGGESAPAYAARIHYSKDWAKWKSRQIRDKLGVATIKEAIRLADEAGVTRAEFDGLMKAVAQTNEAIAKLAEAASPSEKEHAQAQVQARELDEKEMAKRLGISLDDVKKIRDENDFAKFKAHQERLEKERAEADAAAAAAGNGDGGEEGDGEDGGSVLDGLGGVFNLGRDK